MSPAHLHLVLNHIPVLGTIFGLALLGYARYRREEAVTRAALGTFVAVALLALPAYFTGEPAEEAVEHAPGVAEQAIETHEAAALPALIGVEALGVIGTGGLLLARGGRPVSRAATGAALAVAVATAGLMARTANLGGQIRHPEIRSAASLPSGTERQRERDTEH
jgi:uncharacterized membrane protein